MMLQPMSKPGSHRRSVRRMMWIAAVWSALGAATASAAAAANTVTPPRPTATPGNTAATAVADDTASTLSINLPDVTVTDHNGKPQRFVTDLIKGRSVAVNFIFTSCTSICTPLGATFKGMQDELARRGVGTSTRSTKDVHLISVSVDPLNDTPEELTRYARKFDAAPGWTLVTGSRKSIDAILRAFGVTPGADPNDHSPMVYLGHEPSGRWTRAYGLGEPAVLTRRLIGLATSSSSRSTTSTIGATIGGATGSPTSGPTSAPPGGSTRTIASAAGSTNNVRPVAAAAATAAGDSAPDELAPVRKLAAGQAANASVQSAASGSSGVSYFTNLPLVSQDRPRLRFYDDLVRGKIVLINSFYASCADVCSPVSFNLANAQKLLDEQLDTPVQLVSISTDPVADTPELLRDYAKRHGARPGWSFVTGKKENVDWVLHKLGLYNEDKTQHSAILWIGNERSGAWLKLHALAPPEAIVAAVRKIL